MPRLSTLVRSILAGTQDLHDAALGLRDSEIQWIESLRRQYESLEEIERAIEKVEQAREALYPKPIPLETLVTFQPEFKMPATRVFGKPCTDFHLVSSHKVQARRASGLAPASTLVDALCSKDEKRSNIVSVNVTHPVREETNIESEAHYLTYNAANGAIPIAIELYGDAKKTGLSGGDLMILESRAYKSALFIIDPAKLSNADQRKIETREGAGEIDIEGAPPDAIVCMVAASKTLFENALLVGDCESSVYCPALDATITLRHPDYKTALMAIREANPRKALCYHVTRLGDGKPLK